MAVCANLELRVECDSCKDTLDVPTQIPLASLCISKKDQVQFIMELEEGAIGQAQAVGWLVMYGYALCPQCIKTVAQTEVLELPSTKGLFGALDRVILPKQIIKEAKRKVARNGD